MNKILHLLLMALTAVSLAACGDGGGGDSADGPSGEVSTLPTPVDSPPATTSSESFWTMDGYTYLNGGFGADTIHPNASRNTFEAVSVITTETLSGGDQSNGRYSGSNLNFSFLASGASTYAVGTYNVIGSRSGGVFGTLPAERAIDVSVTVGTNVTTGAVMYRAQQGQIELTVGVDGKPRFSSKGPITITKSIEVAGGIPGAPQTMTLNVKNAYSGSGR
jgi:hypothetical protein